MRAELGVGESGLQRVVRGAFALLELIAFFTAGEDKPAQSLAPARGLTAWHAAGEIHTDIQKGFVRAEVIGWEELVDAGGYAGARDRGTLRLEGRDYVMRDGDVHHRQVHALSAASPRGDRSRPASGRAGAALGGLDVLARREAVDAAVEQVAGLAADDREQQRDHQRGGRVDQPRGRQ